MQYTKTNSSLGEFQTMMSMHQHVSLMESLPNKPYCMGEKGSFTVIRPKLDAIKRPIIQINQPNKIAYLVFDDDKEDAVMSWFDAGLPRPYWTTQNPENGHCHHVYKLELPVLTNDYASLKAIRYMRAIYYAYALRLGADFNYSHLLTKNPLHNQWRTTYWTQQSYSLEYLADFVDLPKKVPARLEMSGIGRNVTLFENGRRWAYKAIKDYRYASNKTSWNQAVKAELESINRNFDSPLPFGEINHTAKSIANWVWRNHAAAYEKFSKRQSAKGKIGASVANSKGACNAGGKARSAQYSDLRHEALKLHMQGHTIKEVSETLKIHRNSISKWIRLDAQVPS